MTTDKTPEPLSDEELRVWSTPGFVPAQSETPRLLATIADDRKQIDLLEDDLLMLLTQRNERDSTIEARDRRLRTEKRRVQDRDERIEARDKEIERLRSLTPSVWEEDRKRVEEYEADNMRLGELGKDADARIAELTDRIDDLEENDRRCRL